MQTILKRRNRMLQIATAMFSLVALADVALADIFQWEYVNPADPSQGKQQSTTLAPDGAGVDAVPGANLAERNLTMAYLIGADVRNASFYGGTLSDADFNGAEVRGANFEKSLIPSLFGYGSFGPFGTGIMPAQLYSTASYQSGDLSGVNFGHNDLAGGNFAGQNLANAHFGGATLTDADLTGAEIRGARFGKEVVVSCRSLSCFDTVTDIYGTGVTLAQLYSTSSYQAHDLSGIGLYNNNLAGANFASQNLANASFYSAALTGSDFAGANVRRAGFSRTTSNGFTAAHLYSTASYQARDLGGIGLELNDLSGWNFASQNLIYASFVGATLTGANFADAEVRQANFGATTSRGFTLAQLYSTASYQAHDLRGIGLDSNDLSGGIFTGQNLTNASFANATLTGADFTGAEVRGTSLWGTTYYGFIANQLYSTASYQAHDLTGIILIYNNLSGWNFAGQNLTNGNLGANLTRANFREANLTNVSFVSCAPVYPSGGCGQVYATFTDADLTTADARGAFGLNVSDATTANLIRPDGRIDGLDLDDGALLVVRDYDGRPMRTDPSGVAMPPLPPISITVDQHLAMAPGGTLRMVFEADSWDSTISFAPGIPVTLGGTLELTFAPDVNLANHVGRTFDLFDWTGVNPTGAFAIASPYNWDLSNLYISGKVTLTAIPEPSAIALAAATVISFFACLMRLR
jgi:uncharacterized protein YjbI with pentapeptide repeats